MKAYKQEYDTHTNYKLVGKHIEYRFSVDRFGAFNCYLQNDNAKIELPTSSIDELIDILSTVKKRLAQN